MDTIKKFVSDRAKLTDSSLLAFTNLFSKKTFLKGDILYNTGESSRKFFILEEGIARSVVLDSSGNPRTRSLFTSPSIFTSLISSLRNKPSKAEFNCLTDCVIYEGSFKSFINLANSFHDISILYNRVLEEAFINMQEKATILSTLDATERYLHLKEKIPNIENLIQLNHIASYLNITPIQLSRIRKKLYS